MIQVLYSTCIIQYIKDEILSRVDVVGEVIMIPGNWLLPLAATQVFPFRFRQQHQQCVRAGKINAKSSKSQLRNVGDRGKVQRFLTRAGERDTLR